MLFACGVGDRRAIALIGDAQQDKREEKVVSVETGLTGLAATLWIMQTLYGSDLIEFIAEYRCFHDRGVLEFWNYILSDNRKFMQSRCHSGSDPPENPIRPGSDMSIRGINGAIGLPLSTSRSELRCIHANLT